MKLYIIIIIILIIMLLCSNKDTFQCNSNPSLLNESNNITKKILENDNYKENNKEKMTNKIWNNNNTLDSRLGNPSVKAPDWWYPKDTYDPKHFKSKWHSDKYEAKYNILGDSRRFWQFS